MQASAYGAQVALAREVGDALHRYANALAQQPSAPSEGDPSIEPAIQLSKTAWYYARQAKFLGKIIERDGSVSVAEGRVLARESGYGRGWQRFWAGDGLLAREGYKLTITKKGRQRHKFALDYVGRSNGNDA